jgi:thiol:disulfide interchange protein DsbA
MKKFVASLGLVLPLLFGMPVAHALDAGIDYAELSPAQRTDVKHNQVEVLEFFWYRCPHCFHIEPALNAWVKKLPKDVVLKRVPGILNDQWMPLARAYYALESLNLVDKLHDQVFDAIHVQHIDLNNPETFFDWAVTKGVDRHKLVSAYNSFGVNSKVMRAKQMTKAYKLTGVPSFAVDGKYTTSAYMAGGQDRLFDALDGLVDMELKVKGLKR